MDQARLVAQQIGQRVRTVRRQRGLTLEALGKETNLSAAFLSRIERGEAATSIASLIVIATSLDIPLRDFFEDTSDANVAKSYTVSRRATRTKQAPLEANGYTFHWLSGELADPELSAFSLEFPAKSNEDIALLTHEGEEILYILEGQIEFQIGDDRFVLEAGDCVHFHGDKPHMGRNIGRTPARMLMVVTPSQSIGSAP